MVFATVFVTVPCTPDVTTQPLDPPQSAVQKFRSRNLSPKKVENKQTEPVIMASRYIAFHYIPAVEKRFKYSTSVVQT